MAGDARAPTNQRRDTGAHAAPGSRPRRPARLAPRRLHPPARARRGRCARTRRAARAGRAVPDRGRAFGRSLRKALPRVRAHRPRPAGLALALAAGSGRVGVLSQAVADRHRLHAAADRGRARVRRVRPRVRPAPTTCGSCPRSWPCGSCPASCRRCSPIRCSTRTSASSSARRSAARRARATPCSAWPSSRRRRAWPRCASAAARWSSSARCCCPTSARRTSTWASARRSRRRSRPSGRCENEIEATWTSARLLPRQSEHAVVRAQPGATLIADLDVDPVSGRVRVALGPSVPELAGRTILLAPRARRAGSRAVAVRPGGHSVALPAEGMPRLTRRCPDARSRPARRAARIAASQERRCAQAALPAPRPAFRCRPCPRSVECAPSRTGDTIPALRALRCPIRRPRVPKTRFLRSTDRWPLPFPRCATSSSTTSTSSNPAACTSPARRRSSACSSCSASATSSPGSTPAASCPATAARRSARSTSRCGRRRSSSTARTSCSSPGLNEDLAATSIWGTQQVNLHAGAKVDGVFAMWYGKGPGVDRCGDVFKHANMAGTSKHGGVLVLAGDDHAAKSSTLPHQSDHQFSAAMMPVLYPSSVQEILDLGLHGWAMSRYSGCWVGFKCVADTVESRARPCTSIPSRTQIIVPDDFPLPPDGVSIRWPDAFLETEARMQDYKIYAALHYCRVNQLNRVVIDSPEAAARHRDVRQELPGRPAGARRPRHHRRRTPPRWACACTRSRCRGRSSRKACATSPRAWTRSSSSRRSGRSSSTS